MRTYSGMVVALAMLGLVDCGLAPERVSLSDAKIAPMLKAMNAVDRGSFGFTPVPTNARVYLETGPRSGYDTMLHIYAATSRTVAFRKTSDGYRWIFEQELHYGPKMWKTVDGDVQEHIVVEYQLERVDGIPTNEVHISYVGEDSRLAGRYRLTLSDVQPILEEWRGTKIR